MNLKSTFFTLLIFLFVFSKPTTVHIIPHSHCDPGWRMTTEEYFSQKVKFIFEQTISYLVSHPNVTFNWVETIFLKMWYEQATPSEKSNFHALIDSKQLHLVMAGMVMNDQACITYSQSISQMTLGHVYVQSTFGRDIKPNSGWSLDPFGISSTQTYIYSLMGFKYHVLSRIPIETLIQYRETQHMEFLWDPLEPSNSQEILTHVLYANYQAPQGFKFWLSFDPDNPRITPSNIASRAAVFIKLLRERNEAYDNGGNLLLMFGDDFVFTNAQIIYDNLNMLIEYINGDATYSNEFHITYSSPYTYFDSISIPKKYFPQLIGDDFFVYNDYATVYWSGYFVSQPKLKIIDRLAEKTTKLLEMFFALSIIHNNDMKVFNVNEMLKVYNSLQYLRLKNAEFQHHDAITGTEKFYVTNDYVKKVTSALSEVSDHMNGLYSMLISTTLLLQHDKKIFIHQVDMNYKVINEKGLSNDTKIGFFITNALGWKRKEQFITIYVKISNDIKNYDVTITNGNEQHVYSSNVVNVNETSTLKRVIFMVPEIAPFSIKYFIFHLKNHKKKNGIENHVKMNDGSILENDFYRVEFCNTTNKISKIINKKKDISMNFVIDFYYYKSYSHIYEQNSGAYIFKPDPNHNGGFKDGLLQPKLITNKATIVKTFETSEVIEIHQEFDDFIGIVNRLYKGKEYSSNFFEVQFYKLGEIPMDHEVVISVRTDLNNNGVLYHDELAFEMKRKDVKKRIKMDIQGNFYPMQYSSFIRDENKGTQMTIITTKSQSVTSLMDGDLSMMIHRRCSKDDLRGVDQPLDDHFIIQEKDYFKLQLFIDEMGDSSNDLRHKLSYETNFDLGMLVMNEEYWNIDIKEFPKDFLNDYSFFINGKELNNELNLISFKKIFTIDNKLDDEIKKGEFKNEFILRISNVYQQSELKESIQVNLDSLFIRNISNIVECNLSLLNLGDGSENKKVNQKEIDFSPLSIRTFRVEFQ